MRTVAKAWNLDTVKRRKSKINPQPQYQRTPVWSDPKKQLLIDSILRGYDIPKFYFRESTPPYEHEVVDGQQRLLAIWDYLDDKLERGEESSNLPQGDLSGKLFSQLPSDVQDRLSRYHQEVCK